MFRRYLLYLIICLTGAAVFLGGGCLDSRKEQFLRENPFHQDGKSDSPSILIVTCNYVILEMPGFVNIPQQSFWGNYALPEKRTLPLPAVISGFTGKQILSWHKNGLDCAMGSMNDWESFLDSLKSLGGWVITDQMSLYRHASDMAELPTYLLEQPRSVFIADSEGALRGWTLREGNCFFQVNCVPTKTSIPVDSVQVKVSPAFRSVMREVLPADNELGFIRKRPEIIFDQLTLSGALRNGYFLAIACHPGYDTSTTLGQVFLRRNLGAENYQLIFLLVPRVRTAEQMKNEHRQAK